MNLNEILLLITICWSSLVLFYFYIKFKRRNLPTFEQVLSLCGESSETLSLLFEKQSEYLNERIKSLKRERDKLLEDYDEPDKTLH